jgi:hypothetical protein
MNYNKKGLCQEKIQKKGHRAQSLIDANGLSDVTVLSECRSKSNAEYSGTIPLAE